VPEQQSGRNGFAYEICWDVQLPIQVIEAQNDP